MTITSNGVREPRPTVESLKARIENLAREVADLVLLEDACREITDAVKDGRVVTKRMLDEVLYVITRIDTRRATS